MALVSSYKSIAVKVPSAVEIIKIASISAPGMLLSVRVLTTAAVIDGPVGMGAQIGVTNAEATSFFPIPFAWISHDNICFLSNQAAILSPDIQHADGPIPNKPSWWAIRYQPGGYTGAIIWRAKVYFDVLK